MNDCYVYMFHDEGGVPYYIGKSSGQSDRRIKTHFNCATKNYQYPLARKIRKLQKENKKVTYQKVAENLSEKTAFEMEMYLISFYKRRKDGGVLLNLSLGGEGVRGVTAYNKGKKMSDEQRKILSEAKKGIYPEHLKKYAELRKQQTQERKKAEIAEAIKNPKPKKENVRKGKVLVKDSEGRNFFIDKKDSRYLSGEVVSISKGVKYSDEYKENMSKRIKEINDNITPEDRKLLYGKSGSENGASSERSLERYGCCPDSVFEQIISEMSDRGKKRAITFRKRYLEKEKQIVEQS